MSRSLINRIGGHGLLAIWLAQKLGEIAKYCAENDVPLPMPEPLAEFQVTLGMAMVRFCNLEMPPHIQMQAIPLQLPPTVLRDIVEGHKHFDRHGNQISCTTFHFLHSRADYGIVGRWESDDGNTVISTLWIGDPGCLFETRVLSTDTRWHNHTMDHDSEPAAVAGHEAMIKAFRAYPPAN